VSAGCLASLGIAYRRVGQGPRHVLLLHALTGGPDAADGPTTKGWWGPLFHPGGALDETGCTTWCPNLPWSCYGTAWPKESRPSVRAQASLLADWLEAEDLSFDLLLGGSLGGMVALELALIAPQRFRTLGVIGCGGRADAWLWGANAVQRAILDNRCLTDGDAIALARRAAMLTFRTPEGLGQRFATGEAIRGWLDHHGAALAARFTRGSYRALLEAMDGHDLGRERGGLESALQRLEAPLHLLGMRPDQLFSPASVEELGSAARAAGRLGSLAWLDGPHGHDAFLIDLPALQRWVARVLEAPCARS